MFAIRDKFTIHTDLGNTMYKGKGKIVTGWNLDIQSLIMKPHLSLGHKTSQTFLEIVGAIVVDKGTQDGLTLIIQINPTLGILYQALPMSHGA